MLGESLTTFLSDQHDFNLKSLHFKKHIDWIMAPFNIDGTSKTITYNEEQEYSNFSKSNTNKNQQKVSFSLKNVYWPTVIVFSHVYILAIYGFFSISHREHWKTALWGN